VEFIEWWHLDKFVVVIVAYAIIHYKKINYMELMREIIVHLFTSVSLAYLVNLFIVIVGPVDLNGELSA
jgi:hypothetical protein